ncbi:EF-P beta-lysylation protein EpmB [Psychrobacter pygoscelis]|uniref:EF-P beta-lysylation protein EpmB n=1 Tax=Psychrobacter pygoscelis TaxID=2488563 RepID=UPI00103AB3D3|nr:EF-P beta-lysylation protein EpmB [Psychrobacter pygoscelis]
MINHLITQKNWQTQLSTAITSVDELLSLLKLERSELSVIVPDNFGLRVPRAFVNKMQAGDANDPLLRQVLPTAEEQISVSGYTQDPLAENAHNPIKGLLHKYQSRVLLTITGACAIHCRYCFRQHFDYGANLPTSKEQEAIVDYISDNPDINEVILSGGDPLSISNRRLFAWLDCLEAIPQLTTIRLHTRLPLVIPERIDAELLQRLAQSRCQLVMVIHCNHANEIDDNTAQYLQRLKQIGVTLLNQTVLLAGINDQVETQVALSHRLFAAGVLPYYLHVLDKVAGAAHFDCDEQQAITLYWQLLSKLPGYLVPKLVRELPNFAFKTPIDIYQAD